jgi:DNA-binding MurR/RpiR family transcriptional regulator
MDKAAETYETLGRRISGAYDALSPALKAVARVVSQNPNDIGILNLTALSMRHKIPASNFVRFSKSMGFSGFSDLQRVYRNRIEEIIPAPEDRLERFSQETGSLSNDQGPLGQWGQPNTTANLKELLGLTQIT